MKLFFILFIILKVFSFGNDCLDNQELKAGMCKKNSVYEIPKYILINGKDVLINGTMKENCDKNRKDICFMEFIPYTKVEKEKIINELSE
jgi:hypothetical protein